MDISISRLLITALTSGGVFLALQCFAADTPANIQRVLDTNNCSACHGKTEPVVGPAFNAVAAKYANTPDAADRLVGKVRSGGSGVWGQVAMPPNPGITDADLRTVLAWILKQTPGHQ
ncbi:Cytochrome c-551 [Pandoraea terrae]|uniref:Cytochrome c-551 n=1 Tax=Pandoraea terrae TaxID=1537710 RepID=A0A5E4XXJ8_9BURK|nr:c-type cytochrome [Pandoraea terrae]VVE40963.1 Cytochrome c-551 [Pandoraea terrae]